MAEPLVARRNERKAYRQAPLRVNFTIQDLDCKRGDFCKRKAPLTDKRYSLARKTSQWEVFLLFHYIQIVCSTDNALPCGSHRKTSCPYCLYFLYCLGVFRSLRQATRVSLWTGQLLKKLTKLFVFARPARERSFQVRTEPTTRNSFGTFSESTFSA